MTNKKSGFFAYVLVAILTVVCLCLYVANVNAPYYEDMNINVVYTLVAALVTLVVAIALSGCDKTVSKVICDVARVAASALIIYAGVTFIGMRLESFGYIYGSNLELGNQLAFDAGGLVPQTEGTLESLKAQMAPASCAAVPTVARPGPSPSGCLTPISSAVPTPAAARSLPCPMAACA